MLFMQAQAYTIKAADPEISCFYVFLQRITTIEVTHIPSSLINAVPAVSLPDDGLHPFFDTNCGYAF